jgi:hypothetical protein
MVPDSDESFKSVRQFKKPETIDMCNDLLATGEPATRLMALYKNIR